MDYINNPFSPGAGSPPPELVGRDSVLEQAKVLFKRVRKRRAEKSLMLIGLRGVGKTVLLNEIEKYAQEEKYHTVFLEVHEGKNFSVQLTPHLRTLFFRLSRKSRISEKVRYGLRVLKGFANCIKIKYADFEFGLDIDPEPGEADSGDLEVDLPNLFTAVAEAAEECDEAIALLIDEIQYLSEKELSALIMSMHRIQQKQLPFIFIGAGLPILTRLAGESKSYAERLFDFPEIGRLAPKDAARALIKPVKNEGVDFNSTAVNEIVQLTQGYPYFIQEWGYQAWNHASGNKITLKDVKNATQTVLSRLDDNFFRIRFDRLTPTEKKFLKAMADLGPGPQKSGAIASALNQNVSSIGPTRARLINKGMIYSPHYGKMAFSVPLFDKFMKRVMTS